MRINNPGYCSLRQSYVRRSRTLRHSVLWLVTSQGLVETFGGHNFSLYQEGEYISGRAGVDREATVLAHV